VRIFQLAILAAAAPLILSASTVDFTSSNDTVSFVGSDPGTLTLGSNNCSFGRNATCTLTGTQDIGGTFYTFTFTTPDSSGSPFSYDGEPSAITTSGSPVLDFTISDNHGDTATGTFALTSLASDSTPIYGHDGVDIDGTITISSITAGSNISTFDSLFGLPSASSLSFVLDVGECTNGYGPSNCIQSSYLDPTAQTLSLDITPGKTSAVPEPGALGLLSVASGAMLMAVRRRSKKS
jgi:hypothetical protein